MAWATAVLRSGYSMGQRNCCGGVEVMLR